MLTQGKADSFNGMDMDCVHRMGISIVTPNAKDPKTPDTQCSHWAEPSAIGIFSALDM